ncbi:TnsA endonuclease N-terminal domain-containing protein [Wenzhouxiangella sp. EGI_FJ10409]|uniref:TnsA endonuclease N-terminal domain-containing protein n=1 Tax=Wenzhouxiangella sp. EGI_FJ10409 TaxID=3243767 RepID=UPI0035DDF5F3
MLSDDEFEPYLADLSIPDEGRQYVIQSRKEAPTRQIGRGAEQSVTGHAFSEINQATRCFESREELAWIRRLEHQSKNVLEYHSQPLPIHIYRHDKLGRPQYRDYTPDLLVLLTDIVQIIEVKTAKDAQQLVESNPKDWVQEGDCFTFLPARAYFSKIGLDYKVGLAEEISRLEARNHTLLHRVRCTMTEPDLDAVKTITDRLSKETFLTLGYIRESLGDSHFHAALWLIDQGAVSADLQRQSLVDDCAIVAENEELLESAASELHARNKQTFESVDIAEFGNRKAVEHYASKEGAEHGTGRTARRYRKRLASARPGSARSSVLMPQFHLRGNRKPKIAPEVQELLTEFVHNIPNESFNSRNEAFREYKSRARKAHPDSPPVSKKTFSERFKGLDPVTMARKAGGRRAANQARASTPAIKRHAQAQRPFERVTMDHTQMDGFVRVATSSLGALVLRPWLTIVTDEATRVMLFFLLTLKQPSRRVFALVFRELARRYGRIFESLHTDGGKDMNSVFTRQLAAEYEFTYTVSPSGNSRWNGIQEGVFASVNSSFIADYPAQCIQWKERSLSRKFQPYDKVVDNLLTLYPKFEEAKAAYNEKLAPGSRLSRGLLFNRLLERFPMSGIPVDVDSRFQVATSVDCDDYTVSDRGSIQKLGKHYTPTSDNLVTGPRKKEVREDPENPYLIRFLVDGRWQCATAPGFERFEGLSHAVRLDEAAHHLEGAEAKAHLDELAAENQHEKLVALAEVEKERLEEKRRHTVKRTSSTMRDRAESIGLFAGLERPEMEFDEQDD